MLTIGKIAVRKKRNTLNSLKFLLLILDTSVAFLSAIVAAMFAEKLRKRFTCLAQPKPITSARFAEMCVTTEEEEETAAAAGPCTVRPSTSALRIRTI